MSAEGIESAAEAAQTRSEPLILVEQAREVRHRVADLDLCGQIAFVKRFRGEQDQPTSIVTGLQLQVL